MEEAAAFVMVEWEEVGAETEVVVAAETEVAATVCETNILTTIKLSLFFSILNIFI